MKKNEQKILKFFRDAGRMPSITEAMKLFRVASRSSAFYILKKLVEAGIVKKDSSGKILPSSSMHELRLLGNIRAGFASPGEDELADTITVGEHLIRDKDSSYILEVEGDSMKDAGIQEGDMVIFERRSDAKTGQIVVALTEDGYTLKYLRKDGKGKMFLEAANDSYPRIHPKEGEIIGIVVSSFRKYV